MSYENRISLKINSTDTAAIKQAINTLDRLLKPHLKALKVEERRQLPKVADGNLPFVEKAMDYAESDAEFAPKYLNIPEMRVDYNAVDLLTSFIRPLEQLVDNLEDSITISGSELYVSSLTYYQSIKQAAKTNVPGAKAIEEDLAKRFKHHTKRDSSNEEEEE